MEFFLVCALCLATMKWHLVYSIHRTAYSHMKMYIRQDNDPNKYCDGWICEYSGLTKSIINQLLNADNEMRDNWAASNNVSNLYMLEWYPVLEYWGQDKANLCLPPSANEFYDFVVIEKYGVPNRDDVYKDACQVAVVSDAVKAADTSPERMRNRVVEYTRMNKLRHFVRLPGNRWDITRKQASQMGCGYTLRLNKTHYIDHLVCLYGSFRLGREEAYYREKKGAPCTGCNYYKTEYPWRCGKRYKHLCVGALTDEYQTAQVIKKECTESLARNKPKRMNFNQQKLMPTVNGERSHGQGEWDNAKKPVSSFLQLFNTTEEGPSQSFVDNVAKARSFTYHEKPNDSDCHTCVYMLIVAGLMSLLLIAFSAYVLYRQKLY